jgi:hypothetical protein
MERNGKGIEWKMCNGQERNGKAMDNWNGIGMDYVQWNGK